MFKLVRNKRLRNSIILVMFFAMILALLTPIVSFAKSSSEEQSIEGLISKADPFVYLDYKSEKFKIKKEANNVLTKVEIGKVEEIIKDTNMQISKYRSDLIIDGNKFVAKIESNGDLQTYSIDKSKNFDWEFTWWGLRVYWSHKFVEKLKENIALYGAGVAALNATISYFISPPGWVTSFVSAVAGIGLWGFIKQDKGCGVYLDCYLYVPTVWYSAC
jgi:hypothetical protein